MTGNDLILSEFREILDNHGVKRLDEIVREIERGHHPAEVSPQLLKTCRQVMSYSANLDNFARTASQL